MTDDELRALPDHANVLRKHAGLSRELQLVANLRNAADWMDALAAEVLRLRAKEAAAVKLAKAARYFCEYGENDRALFQALTAWEAAK